MTQPAEMNGADFIATLQQKSGFVPSKDRPGWSMELDGGLLPASHPLGKPLRWTTEQREKGVELDFVFLTLEEHRKVEGRMARRFKKYGGDSQSLPHVMFEERCICALSRIDGKELESDDERDRAWEEFGLIAQGVIASQYLLATDVNPESIKAQAEAQARAARTFRVRG